MDKIKKIFLSIRKHAITVILFPLKKRKKVGRAQFIQTFIMTMKYVGLRNTLSEFVK